MNELQITNYNPAAFETYRKENQPEVKSGMRYWGAKEEGRNPGDFVDGILLGYSLGKFNATLFAMKSFTHNGELIYVYGCSSLDRQFFENPEQKMGEIFQVGEVLRITFLGSFVGTKGKGIGQMIASYRVDCLRPYTLTQQDINDINKFKQMSMQQQPLQVIQQPQQQVSQFNQFQQQAPPFNQFAQKQPPQFVQQTQQQVSKKSPFDI